MQLTAAPGLSHLPPNGTEYQSTHAKLTTRLRRSQPFHTLEQPALPPAGCGDVKAKRLLAVWYVCLCRHEGHLFKAIKQMSFGVQG
jgi:hypothetical protein